MRAVLLVVAAGLAAIGQAETATPRLGEPVSAARLSALDQTIYPDGRGLPAGSGSVAEGEAVYGAHCETCHGPSGRGGAAEELAGGRRALDGAQPDKTVGTYWPYATTLFDFIRRSMPMHAPGLLSDEQVYAVTAYLLHINGILPADAGLDAESLPRVRMPNRDGFIGIGAEIPEY